MIAPVLVLGYGNPSRGDDAVAPLLIDYLSAQNYPDTDLLTDFQLQIEHLLDIQYRSIILFIDASISAFPVPQLIELEADSFSNFSTHAMSPQQLLAAYKRVYGCSPAPSFLLAIHATKFELGADLSAETQMQYNQACRLLRQMLENPCLNYWQSLTTS